MTIVGLVVAWREGEEVSWRDTVRRSVGEMEKRMKLELGF